MKWYKFFYFLCFVLVCVGFTVFISEKNYTSNVVVNEKSVSNIFLNAISMLYETEAGSGEYQISTDTTWPQDDYVFNERLSGCENGGTLSWNEETKRIIMQTNKSDKCYVYFDLFNESTLKDVILRDNPNVLTRTDFSVSYSEDNVGQIFVASGNETEDINNDGVGEDVYYFAGNPTDNWVSFGGFYWRIIRINGDGTIRLMYQGTEATTTGVETQIGTSVFNNSFVQNEYVGFKYTDGIQHGSDSDSAILTSLTNWYVSNLINYEEYIDVNTGFCSDRNLRDGSSWSSTGYTYQYYAAYDRLVDGKSPSFKCDNIDNFQIPTALITADEIAYAGGVWNTSNYGFYLYTAQDYWTMTPSVFNGTANNFALNRMSSLIANSVSGSFGVRPVINLKADVTITGSGTSTDPYVVS